MENTALVRLFNILNAAEKRRIKRKLENTERKGVDMLLLFNYLDKQIKKPEKLEKKRVYKAVFGKLKKFNDNKLTNLRFKLYRFIENQIVIEQIMANEEHQIQKELILLEYFRYKVVPNSQRSVEGIARLVDSKMNDVENLIKSENLQGIDYHLNLFRLNHFLYYNLNEEIRGEGKPYLDQLMNSLDIFYCLSKLRYSFEMMQRQKIYNEAEFPIFLFNEAYKYSETLNSDEFPLVSIYKLLADLSVKLNIDKIINLKNILFDNPDVLGRAEMTNSLTLLLNFMMQISREKNINTALEEYEVYQFILSNKIYITNGEIRPQFLINCAVNFVIANKNEGIKKMLDDYEGYIPKNYKEKTIKLCSAYQLFGEGKYTECSRLIYQQPFLPFNLQAKTLLLKSLYEIEFNLKKTIEISFFNAHDNYKRFIRRKKKQMNENLYQATFNFANSLLKLTDNTDPTETEKYINNLDLLVERRWLLEKIKKK